MENKELKKEITDEKTGISYTLVGDYYLPNIKLEQGEKVQLNIYGLLRLQFFIRGYYTYFYFSSSPLVSI